MNALLYYAIGFIIIWIIGILLRKKDYITLEFPLLMLKTERLRGTIDRIAKISPKLWQGIMNFGIPLCIIIMVFMIYALILSLQLMFEMPTTSLILPGVDIPGSPIYVPFVSGIIALATVMVIHEFSHGILARTENVPIKSIGLLLFTILPGAFVEPDDEEIEKCNGISKIRIYIAGVMANLGLCLVAFLLLTAVSGFLVNENVYESDGMTITSVVAGSPAEGIIKEGSIIHQINNQSIKSYTDYTTSLQNISKGDTVILSTTSGTYNIITQTSPTNQSKAYIGIRSKENIVVTSQAEEKYGTIIPWILSQLKELLYWIFLLNLAVGTFNILPAKPLDGGLVFEEMLKCKIRPDRRKEFNDSLNRKTRIFPRRIRCFISKIFNKFLNILDDHQLKEETINKIMKLTSTIIMVVIVVLIIYGTVPGILKMI
ncbi:MAG: site-2 protease family protein [Methanobacteriaceae archaeon]|nr:site-2 protease family protein [Methanobacteriaceae archaeon]